MMLKEWKSETGKTQTKTEITKTPIKTRSERAKPIVNKEKALTQIKTTLNFFFIFVYIIIFVLIIAGSPPGVCQQVTGRSISDTARFFPQPIELPTMGSSQQWQSMAERYNMETRDFISTSTRGYRLIVDSSTAPRGGLAFNVSITLLRPGTVQDPRTGEQLPKSRYVFSAMFNQASSQQMKPAQKVEYGDEAFYCQQSFDNYRIFIRRGDYIIDIIGTDSLPDYRMKPSMEEVANFIAYFIDSRIFGARIGIFKPVQVLNSDTVPLVAGKKMVIYVTVELEKGMPLPAPYLLTINIGERGFNRPIYSIPIGSKGKTLFDPVQSDTNDGGIWNQEYAEEVKIDSTYKSYFNLVESQDYETRLYRFFLDPIKPKYYGDYVFKVYAEDSATGSKLRTRVFTIATKQSGTLRVAVMPLPVGYWASPYDWKVTDAPWLTKMNDQAWRNLSYTMTLASLPEEKKFDFMATPVATYLKKVLPTSKGQIRYDEKVKQAREYLKAVLPVAEENFEFYIYDDFPPDLSIDPHTTEVKVLTDSLDAWLKKHPRFHRVIGVVPGGNPNQGGVFFNIDKDTARQFWWRKNCMVVSVQDPVFQFAQDIAHTYGAVDEFVPPGGEVIKKNPKTGHLNEPLGTDGGQPIRNGFWVAKELIMGTPLKPVNSIMGNKDPAWIPEDIYTGILQQIAP